MMAKQIEPGSTWLDMRESDNLFVIGRLKPGVTVEQAKAQLDTVTGRMAEEHPKENAGRSVLLMPPGLFIPDIRNSIFAFSGLLAVVGALVLLLACVNLANLLLARATERRKEIGIRLAIGASRGQLVRQLLTESVMLSLAGGAVGLLLATWTNHLVSSIRLPTDIALLFDLRIDWRVLVFTLALSVLTGMAFSLIPALQASKPELVPALKDESSMAGFRRSRLRNGLVIAQVALSLVLLISAGLIVRSLQAAQRMRPGFNPQNAVALSFDLGLQGYDDAKGRAFYDRMMERAKAIPGVRSVAATDVLPLSLDYSSNTIYIEGQPVRSRSDLPLAIPYSVSPRFFETMGMTLRGRDFLPNENKKEYAGRARQRNLRPPLPARSESDWQTLQSHRADRSLLGNHRSRARWQIQYPWRRAEGGGLPAAALFRFATHSCRAHRGRSADSPCRFAPRRAGARSDPANL